MYYKPELSKKEISVLEIVLLNSILITVKELEMTAILEPICQ